MDNQAKATPRPWHKHETEGKTFASVRGADNSLVADCGSRSDLTAQANASLIVKAVNNHEFMIDALRKAKTVLGKLAEINSFTDESYEAYISVKHALNEAQ